MSDIRPKVCYVTAFYDMKREDWTNFARTFDDYLNCFKPIVDMFRHVDEKEFEMVVYVDKKVFNFVQNCTEECRAIKLISIDDEFMMNNLPMWKTIDREREIMQSEEFRKIIPHRLMFPEHTIPEYTLINHCKIDFICYTIDCEHSSADYFCWVDFGYCKCVESIPTKLLDIYKLNLDKINYTLINTLDNNDSNILYTLLYAPEKIGGFFFFGNKKVLKEYQALYHSILHIYQENNLADDDQALSLACYWKKPDLFHLHGPWGWHKALINFQL